MDSMKSGLQWVNEYYKQLIDMAHMVGMSYDDYLTVEPLSFIGGGNNNYEFELSVKILSAFVKGLKHAI